MAGPFSTMTDFLSAVGFFDYLALLLLFIILYYVFMYLLRKNVERLKNDSYRKLISLVLSGLVVVGVYLLFLSSAGTAATYLVAALFTVAVVFFILVLVGRLAGIDLPEMLKREFG
jgi:heme A synthase